MKIMYVADIDYLKSKMDPNAWERAKALIAKDNVMVIDIKRGKRRDALRLYKRYKPDFILHEHIAPKYPLMLTNLRKVPCETCMLLGDDHSDKKLYDKISPWKNIILFYSTNIEKYKEDFPDTTFTVIGHHINMDYFKDYGFRKTIDVLIYGSLINKWYPFRNRLCKLLLESDLIVLHIENPWGNKEDAIRNAELSKVINQSSLTVCTKSKVDYLVAKYVEAMASLSMPLGNLPAKEYPKFKKRVLYVDDAMTDEEILEKIEVYLDATEDDTEVEGEEETNKEKCLKQLLNNYQWSHLYFGTTNWADKVLQFARERVHSLKGALEKELRGASTILDLCAGKGNHLRHVNAKKTGIEIEEKYKKYLKRHGYEAIISDVIEEIKKIKKKYDVVTWIDGIEHLCEKEALMVLDKAEKIAQRRMLVFTPETFITNEEIAAEWNEPHQVHRSLFPEKFWEERGYKKVYTEWNTQHKINNSLYRKVIG